MALIRDCFVVAGIIGGICFSGASEVWGQGGASRPDFIGKRLPDNARELVELRKFYDDTVWSPEVDAQRHETYFVKLWDRLIHEPDKYRVLADAEFGKLLVGVSAARESLDWGVEILTFPGETREIPISTWLSELDSWQRAGYQIIESEWHHSAFKKPEKGSPTSVVAMLLHVVHPPTNRRIVIKGDLELTWRGGDNPVPESINAQKVKVFQRRGKPAFTSQLKLDYPYDDSGRQSKTTVHPIMVQDMNSDGLPELILGGENTVYWNRGNWKFDKAKLCRLDPGHVNAGAVADFNNDGHLDFLAAVKNGHPLLYLGDGSPEFRQPPQKLNFTPERLIVPVSVAVGDIDADGDLDAFIGQQKPAYESGDIPTPYYDALDSFPAYLIQNDGQGNFRDITATSGLADKRLRRNFSASFIDIDADRDLDLMMTSDFSGTDLFTNDGHGVFTDITASLKPRSAGFGMSHTFGDYNLDGQIDFIMIGMSSTTARRLTQMNLGREEFPDYNHERMNMGYGNRLYLRTATGFEQAPFHASVARTGWSWGSTTLDFDNDGDQDIYIVNGQTSGKTTQDYCTRFWCHDVYYKRGERPDKAMRELFGRMAGLFSGNSISWNGYEHNALMMNRDGKDFVNVGFLMDVASELDSRAACQADFDGDGRVDLLYEHKSIRNLNQSVFLLRNQWEEPHHWVGVHLRQPAGKPSPLGAVVTAELLDGRSLVQHNVTGTSVWTQHANTVHFGLGKAEQIKSLRVTWPNGEVSELAQPAVDQYHVVP